MSRRSLQPLAPLVALVCSVGPHGCGGDLQPILRVSKRAAGGGAPSAGSAGVLLGGESTDGSGGLNSVAGGGPICPGWPAGTEPDGCLLAANASGWVDSTENACGIQGTWYSYNDCAPPSPSADHCDNPGFAGAPSVAAGGSRDTSSCALPPSSAGAGSFAGTSSSGAPARSECTEEHSPAPGRGPLRPNDCYQLCTRGKTADVRSVEELTAKWGAGIALDVNQTKTDSTTPVPVCEKGRLGAIAELGQRQVQGISFVLTGTLPGGLRVNFPTRCTESTAHFVEVAEKGPATVLFRDAKQGDWVAPEDQLELEWRQIVSIQFQVPTAVGGGTRFDFCVGQLKLVY